MASIIEFDIVAFRAQSPEFSQNPPWTDELLTQTWNTATCFISNENYGWLTDDCRALAINLYTAHLLKLSTLIQANQVPGLMQNSTIDKISVGLTPPPLKTQWQWWMSLTAYGQQVFALLQARSVGGFYISCLPERSAIRKNYGVF